MKSVGVIGLALAATVGVTQAAQAPDLSTCAQRPASLAGFVAASIAPMPHWNAVSDVVPATLVADASGETGAAAAPVAPAESASSPSPAPLLVYAETGPDKLASPVAGLPPRVFVPNHSSNTLTVIDPATLKVVDTYRVGSGPQHVVPAFDLKTLWVNNTADGTAKGSVTPVDPATGKAGQAIAVDDPYNMYFTPDGASAIVVAEAYRRLDLRDPATMALKSSIPTPTCAGINHGDYTADFKYAIFTCEFGGVYSGKFGQKAKTKDAGPSLIRVDLAAGKVVDELTFSKPGMPQDVRLSSDGKTFYVTDMINNGVFLVDAEGFKETGFIETGIGAHGLNVSRDGTHLYVANRGSSRMPDKAGGPGSVSVINMANNVVEHTWLIPGGGSPDMGNVSQDGKQLWLAGRFDGQVYVIDTETGAVTKINVGIEPHGLTLWPQPGRFSLGHTGNMR